MWVGLVGGPNSCWCERLSRGGSGGPGVLRIFIIVSDSSWADGAQRALLDCTARSVASALFARDFLHSTDPTLG